MTDRFLIQTAAAHLAVASRLLDRADFKISAAHVAAALDSLSDEAGRRARAGDFIENFDLAALDRMIAEIYVGEDRGTGDPTAD